jgi:hypothetical protein
MASGGERLINVVKNDKPKRLIGLNQKVSGPVILLRIQHTLTIVPPAKRPCLTPSCYRRGTR